MDPISQGAVGAVAATCGADAKTTRRALFVGWIAGMLADADIFIRSASDPLLNIQYHRHFTHSLAFIPVGALVAASLLWLLLGRWLKLPFKRLYVFSFLGYATAGLLDACTSYGTQLLWPFSDVRVAWHIISIVDPIFTLTILVFLFMGFRRRRVGWAWVAGGFAVCYLGLGVVQRERAEKLQLDLAERRGHRGIEQTNVKPSLGNLLLWRSVYRVGEDFYVDGIRVGLVGEPVFYEGKRVPAVSVHSLQSRVPGTFLAEDLARFAHFSDDYLAWHPDETNVLSDLRYAALPPSDLPLWGIRVDLKNPNRHASFETFRRLDKEQRARFFQMLRGQPLK